MNATRLRARFRNLPWWAADLAGRRAARSADFRAGLARLAAWAKTPVGDDRAAWAVRVAVGDWVQGGVRQTRDQTDAQFLAAVAALEASPYN